MYRVIGKCKKCGAELRTCKTHNGIEHVGPCTADTVDLGTILLDTEEN